ncbi:MAG: dienelactone hydrolase family protein [Candidatus Thorarchaeota archaeon]
MGEILIGRLKLKGDLTILNRAKGLIVFAHGSGSSRKSPRNNFVAKKLQEKRLATLLFDLLTEEEDKIYSNRFNIPLLTERLIYASYFVKQHKILKKLKVCYFGSSTGAAAALKAAYHFQDGIRAVVSRGGRVDLADDILNQIKVPTLFIVGDKDSDVLRLNRLAFHKLKCEKKLKILEGASHLFVEPGKIEQVAELAGNWFEEHLN